MLAAGFALAGNTAVASPIFWLAAPDQPNIFQGGRVNALAVDPSNGLHVLATSESGGLFVSQDGGKTWNHVDAFPEFETVSVAFWDPKLVIATTLRDFKSVNAGGIWISRDGGVTWTHQQHSKAPPNPGSGWIYLGQPAATNAGLGAFEISIAPDTRKIYVASNFGVFVGTVSPSRTISWVRTYPFAVGGPCTIASGGTITDSGVYSVFAQSANHVLAGGFCGIRYSNDGGNTWSAPTQYAGARVADYHAFGGPAYDPQIAYAVDGNVDSSGAAFPVLWSTRDGGNTWAKFPVPLPPQPDTCGGISFVKDFRIPALAAGGPPGRAHPLQEKLYVSNECFLYEMSGIVPSGTGAAKFVGPWFAPGLAHWDTRDLAFIRGTPSVLGSDGGIQLTPDGGNSWVQNSAFDGGFTALQLTQVMVQLVDNPVEEDVYIGTQDNSNWANSASSGGLISTNPWNNDGAEGFDFSAQREVNSTAGDQITYVICSGGGCQGKISSALLVNPMVWPDVPYEGSSAVTIENNFQVQAVFNAPAGAYPASGLAVFGPGRNWQQFATFDEQLLHPPIPSIDPGVPLVIYGVFSMGLMNGQSLPNDGLIQMSPTGSSLPMMMKFGGFGSDPLTWNWYRVLAVDHNNPEHLIAPDVINSKMMESRDGGNHWKPMRTLTKLVKGNGRFLFELGPFSLVTAISFNPENSNFIAVGTWENGAFISSDGGKSWQAVVGSQAIPHISSFDWGRSSLYISSYGRGLWNATFHGIRYILAFKPLHAPVTPEKLARLTTLPPQQMRDPTAGMPKLRLVTHRGLGDLAAKPGQEMVLEGQSYRPGQTVKLMLDGKNVANGTVGPDGRFSFKLRAPQDISMHVLTVEGGTADKQARGLMFHTAGGE